MNFLTETWSYLISAAPFLMLGLFLSGLIHVFISTDRIKKSLGGKGFSGIFKLPDAAKFGVYTAYKYYLRLLKKLKRVPSVDIKNKRIRVANIQKMDVLARSYVRYRFNIL